VELGVDVPEDTEADLAVASSSIAFLRLVTVHLEAEVLVEVVEVSAASTDMADEGRLGVIIQLLLVDPVELSL